MTQQYLPSFTMGEIVRATGGSLITGQARKICKGVSTDSRSIKQDNLFIAIMGDNFDGHDFIADAIRGGASGILLKRGRERELKDITAAASVIAVDDTVTALGDIAHAWRNRFDVSVVAITGSTGKTTTKEMTASVVKRSRNVLKSRGNFNNLIGLPLTLLDLNPDHEVAILEMGTNRPGEIARLTEIAKPDVGVITNVGPAHLEGLKSLDGVREEKGALFSKMDARGIAVINQDDEAVGTIATRWKGRRITFGMKGDASVRGEQIISEGERGVHFILTVDGFNRAINMSTLGEHNIYNALAAAACSHALGIDYDDICLGLASFQQVSGRMKLHRLENGAYLIDDTYNANPASMRESLKSLRDLKGAYESTVIFGDMLELGDQAEEIHEDMGKHLADTGVDTLLLRGKLSRAVAAGAEKNGFNRDRVLFMENANDIAAHLKLHLRAGDWVLIKGSRGMKMDDITRAVLQLFGEKPASEHERERIEA